MVVLLGWLDARGTSQSDLGSLCREVCHRAADKEEHATDPRTFSWRKNHRFLLHVAETTVNLSVVTLHPSVLRTAGE